MKYLGWSSLAAVTALAAAGLVSACGDDISEGNNVTPGGGTGGEAGGGGTGGTATTGCTGQCCPEAAECYVSGPSGPGAECLAQIDNTGATKITMRQTWLRAVTPAGNTIPLVYDTLKNRSELPWADCNMSKGTSGYMQLNELDLGIGESRVGYAKYVPATGLDAAITDGLCFVETTYDDPMYRLSAADMSPSTNYPAGLPAPMPQPWTVKPVRAKRLDSDFNVATDRTQLIADLAPTGSLGSQGFTGVFFYDEATGVSHGYSPLTYLVIYDNETKFIVVPVREAETRSTFNDPDAPNCVGAYRADALDPANGCQSTDATDPPWGCVDDACPAYATQLGDSEGFDVSVTGPGAGPAVTSGYFLITELEQVFSSVLNSTLCVSYPTFPVSEMNGWSDPATWGQNCRGSSKWNPSDPIAGLPEGDWCAATNGPATSECHDAYRSLSYHAFSAFKIQADTCMQASPF